MFGVAAQIIALISSITGAAIVRALDSIVYICYTVNCTLQLYFKPLDRVLLRACSARRAAACLAVCICVVLAALLGFNFSPFYLTYSARVSAWLLLIPRGFFGCLLSAYFVLCAAASGLAPVVSIQLSSFFRPLVWRWSTVRPADPRRWVCGFWLWTVRRAVAVLQALGSCPLL